MGSLLGGSKKTSSSTTVNVPSWALEPLQTALGMGVDASKIPYEDYSGQRYADFTPDELTAQQMTRDLMGQYGSNFTNANDILTQVARSGTEGYSQDYLNKFINPYTQNVLDIAKRRSLENYDQQMNDFMSKAAQTSSFGGSRTGLAQAQMQRDFQQNLADQETKGLSDAYESALNQANLGMQRAYQGAMGLGTNATQGQAYGLRDAAALGTVGEAQRAMNQQGLDWDYEQWATKKAYPYQQAQFLTSIASPIAGQVSGQTQTQKQSGGSGILGTAIGLGSMALGIPGVSAGLGSLAGSAAGSLGMGFGTASGLNSFFGGATNSPFMSGWGRTGAFAKGGVVTSNSYAQGGAVDDSFNDAGLGYFFSQAGKKLPSSDGGIAGNLAKMYLTGELADSAPIKAGNALAEWAIENPIDALSIGLAIPTMGSSLAGLAASGGKGVGKAVPAVVNAVKNNPQLAATLGIGALQGGKLLKDSNEALAKANDVQNEKDFSNAQDYMMFIATDGKVGHDAPDEASRARYENLISTNPTLKSIAESAKPRKASVQESVLTNANGVNTEKANASSIPSGLAAAATGSKDSNSSSEGWNKPLMAFGAALLSGDDGFFKALGQGIQAYQAQENSDKQQEVKNALLQQELEMNLFKANTDRMRAQGYLQQVNNPYKGVLDALKVQQAQQKLNNGNNKLRDDVILNLIKTGMTDDPVGQADKILQSLQGQDDIIDDSNIPWSTM